MIKSEINEIKKRFQPKSCSITKFCGLYVDGDKNKRAEIDQLFLSLPEEEMYKYFDIMKKTLSGNLGKNLMNLDFPMKEEEEGGTQSFLMKLRRSQLKEPALLEEFYDKIIENFEYLGGYLILLFHDIYDVPGKTKDNFTMEDASEEMYEYLLCCICPVELSKPGLSYNPMENTFQNRIRDYIVGAPVLGFLFPAFNDRSTDIHSLLYYTKDREELNTNFVDTLLSCQLPLTAGSQKEVFQSIVEETLGDECSIDSVLQIHETLNQMVEEHKDDPVPYVLDKNEVKSLLASSGVSNEKMDDFEEEYETVCEEDTPLYASNIAPAKTFEVKTPDVVIKVKPDRTNLIETRTINGRQCLVIALEGGVEVNGINVRPATEQNTEEEAY